MPPQAVLITATPVWFGKVLLWPGQRRQGCSNMKYWLYCHCPSRRSAYTRNWGQTALEYLKVRYRDKLAWHGHPGAIACLF